MRKKVQKDFGIGSRFYAWNGETHCYASPVRSFRRFKKESSITSVFKFLPTLSQLQGRMKSLEEILFLPTFIAVFVTSTASCHICFRFLVSSRAKELIIETSLFKVSVYGDWCFLHMKSCYPTAFNIFACGKWFSWVFKFNFVTLHKANVDGAYDSINNAATKRVPSVRWKNSIADWVHKFTTTINKCQCFRH